MNGLIAIGVYLLIGLVQSFAIWIARGERRLGVDEIITCIFVWPYLWLITFFEIQTSSFWENLNKKLFVKVWLALVAIDIIILYLVK